VKLVDKKHREDDSYVYAAKIKRELQQQLVGAQVKTTPISIMGTADRAPLALVVTASELDSAMTFANAALAELRKIKGATETKLTVEAGNPEITVQVDRDKNGKPGIDAANSGSNHADCL
jgi:hypothetical protein